MCGVGGGGMGKRDIDSQCSTLLIWICLFCFRAIIQISCVY